MADIKKALREFIDAEKQKKAGEEAERQRRNVEDRNAMIASIGADLAESLKPILAELPNSAKITAEQVKEALISSIQVNIPEMSTEKIEQSIERAFSNIKIPEPKVTVNVPEVKIPPMPPINVPPMVMPERMAVSMPDYSNEKPMPVMLMDLKGRPFQFPVGGGGGGKTDFLTIKGFSQSAYSELTNADGRLRVSVETGGSGLTDSELRASAVPVSQASGAIWSTNVVSAFGSTAVGSVFNADNRIRVSVETGGSGLTDAELRASGVPVSQVSGANWSTNVTNTVTVSATDLDIRDLVNTSDSVRVYQLSGASWSTEATQSGTWNIGTVTTVTGITNSVATVGNVASDVADNGDGPVKIGGIARTANPTAVAAGDRVSATFDDLGRQIMRPHQVRDLIATAYISLTNGTETTLLAGAASTFHDMLYLMCANQSDAATYVDFRSGTGGSVMKTVQIPASGTAGGSLPVAIPMTEAAQAWTADMPDITGTTIDITAVFSKEV